MRILKIFFTALFAYLTYVWVYTSLTFTPVPWPDGSAFYLPGFDWLLGSLKYRMHAQSAFVPSYDEANFNTMPFLPALFGFAQKLGLSSLFCGPVQMTRVLSLVPLFAASYFVFLISRPKGLLISLLLSLCLLFDPVLRWGTLVVRPETWIGCIWIIILYLLKNFKPESKQASWGVPFLLALGAYIHFEAIYLVPGLIVWGLIQFKKEPKVLVVTSFKYALRTLLFLSPWLIYVFINWALFWKQMDIQFHRLEQANVFTQSFYSFFHSLFLSLGSAESWPKLFNLYKILFWIAVFGLFGFSVLKLKNIKSIKSNDSLFFANTFVFCSFLYLWIQKPEVWFITLVHFGFWTWIMTWISEYNVRFKFQATTLATFLLLSISTQAAQWIKIPKQYSWNQYEAWTDCIHREAKAFAGARGRSDSLRLWQPHVPDVLVDLQSREPRWELTRALDFQKHIDLAWKHTFNIDVLVLSRHFKVGDPKELAPIGYKGKARGSDIELMKDGVEVPFGPWVLERFPKEHQNPYSIHVCHYPPFWAGIILLNNP